MLVKNDAKVLSVYKDITSESRVERGIFLMNSPGSKDTPYLSKLDSYYFSESFAISHTIACEDDV